MNLAADFHDLWAQLVLFASEYPHACASVDVAEWWWQYEGARLDEHHAAYREAYL